MATIRYQIIHNPQTKVENTVKQALLKALEENTYLEKSEYDDFQIEIAYSRKVDENQTLTAITLCLDKTQFENEIDIDDLLTLLHSELLGNENIKHITKFSDNNLLTTLKQYYPRIFSLEMKIREAVSYILVATYKKDYLNLLKDYNISNRLKNTNIQAKNKNYLENECFHLLFSDYISLSHTKQLKFPDLLTLVEKANDFNSLQEALFQRGIIHKDYQDFFASIKEHLNNIEKIRNCVAHNRTPAEKEVDNFENSYSKLDDILNNYFANLN